MKKRTIKPLRKANVQSKPKLLSQREDLTLKRRKRRSSNQVERRVRVRI